MKVHSSDMTKPMFNTFSLTVTRKLDPLVQRKDIKFGLQLLKELQEERKRMGQSYEICQQRLGSNAREKEEGVAKGKLL